MTTIAISAILHLLASGMNHLSKCFVAILIVCNPDLSDEKVKYLTKMMSKDISIDIPNKEI